MPTINSIMDDLEEENKNLREKIKRLDNDNTALQHTVDDFVVKCKDLQSAYDKEHSRWVELAENYDRLETKYRRLEREHSGEVDNEIDELKKQIASLENELEEEHKARIARDELCIEKERRISCLKQENEDLKAKKDNVLAFYRIKQLEETNARLIKENKEANDTLEKANRDRNDLQRQLDAECKKRCDLEEKLDDIGKRYYETSKRVGELVREKYIRQRVLENTSRYLKKANAKCFDLQRQLDILKHKDVVFVDLDSVKLKGMEELWAMLGTMYAADPIEVAKIFGWFSINNIAHYTPDVREFLKKYETWKSGKDEKEAEQKHLDYMRDYLRRFCVGKVCCGCPLNTPEFKCYGLGGFDSISDEDLKKYYEKARGCGRFPWTEKKEEKPSDEEVPCSFSWKLYGTEFTIETSIPKEEYDNIVKIISGKE